MQTIQLQIQDDNLANKILSILNVFKDDGVLIENISTKNEITEENFKEDIKNAFLELQNNQGKHTNKFIEIEV